ncbi:MAG: GNAT family N-acetyltransferase [Ilumatobacteraceae bacterium]
MGGGRRCARARCGCCVLRARAVRPSDVEPLLLAVRPGQHRAGLGSTLVAQVEDALRSRGAAVARVLIVETSSLDGYERARSFYRQLGYDEEAHIREFYGPGDDKIAFWKALTAPVED